MRPWRLSIGVAAILVLAAGGGTLEAQSGCRAKCESWLAWCKQQCTQAPDTDECVANCRIAYQQCLDGC